MSDELVLFNLLENDQQAFQDRKRLRAQLRDELDPFLLEESEFVKEYRLTKNLARDLCEELRPKFREPKKHTDLSVEAKVLTALSFYGTGSYQRPIGGIGGHSMAQQTVSSVIAEVTANLDSAEMRRKYIVFPQTLAERDTVRQGFFNKFGIPGVLGCIDGSHVAIVRPILHEERYFCRKHYHSLNVQLICDSEMQITSVDASHGGSTHDSFIWNSHPVKGHLENLNENTWLLGDSGYPLRKYLMTPILDAAPGTPEENYTKMHVKTRCTIERTIGLLKARFRCLLSHRVLHYRPEVAASIVNSCVILHNICNANNVVLPDEITGEDLVLPGSESVIAEAGSQALSVGVATRQSLVTRLSAAAVREV